MFEYIFTKTLTTTYPAELEEASILPEEKDDNYTYIFNLPGVKKSDIEVKVQNFGKTLVVKGGKYKYEVPLSSEVDTSNIKLSLDLGQLKVVLPKKESIQKTNFIWE